MDGQLLAGTFVELTDTMVADFDVIDFLHVLTDRTVALLDVAAAGLLLADPRGQLRVVAASSEAARLLELFQLQNDQGPCLDCFRSAQPVTVADLGAEAGRWPRFAAAARQGGFAAVQALPMRLRDRVIGALNLFRAGPGPFDPADVRIGQALADVATISLLHERSMRHSDALNEQLQTALNSRVVIEQAKGKPPGRRRPGLHRRHRTPHRYHRHQAAADATRRRPGTPSAPARPATQAIRPRAQRGGPRGRIEHFPAPVAVRFEPLDFQSQLLAAECPMRVSKIRLIQKVLLRTQAAANPRNSRWRSRARSFFLVHGPLPARRHSQRTVRTRENSSPTRDLPRMTDYRVPHLVTD